MQLVSAHAHSYPMGGAVVLSWFLLLLVISCEVSGGMQESKRLYLSDLLPDTADFSKVPRLSYRVRRPPLPAPSSFSRNNCQTRGKRCVPWGKSCCPGLDCLSSDRSFCLNNGNLRSCSCHPLGKRFTNSVKDPIWYRR